MLRWRTHLHALGRLEVKGAVEVVGHQAGAGHVAVVQAVHAAAFLVKAAPDSCVQGEARRYGRHAADLAVPSGAPSGHDYDVLGGKELEGRDFA